MRVVVSTKHLDGSTLRRESRQLEAGFHEPIGEGLKVSVPGAYGGRRLDGLIDLDEGLGEPPLWTERMTVIVARGGREFVILTVRRRPDAGLDHAVELIVESFRLFKK